jgi:hypothetical protein
MTTFKNIIKSIENFCDEHLQIKEFGFGPISSNNRSTDCCV